MTKADPAWPCRYNHPKGTRCPICQDWPEEARIQPEPMTDNNALAQPDWIKIAKAAGEHGVRYRTNSALLAFLAEIRTPAPASVEVGEREELASDCRREAGAMMSLGITWVATLLNKAAEYIERPKENTELDPVAKALQNAAAQIEVMPPPEDPHTVPWQLGFCRARKMAADLLKGHATAFRNAVIEGDTPIGAGRLDHPLRHPAEADMLERLAGPVQGEEDGEPDGPDEITALKAEIERQEGLVKIYRRAQLTAEEKLCREQHNAIGWKKRATYLEQRLDQPVQQEVEDQVEECSRNIRIAIWNTAKKQNWSDDAANSFVKEAMAEPCMRAALAAMQPDSGGEVERAVNICRAASHNCATEMMRVRYGDEACDYASEHLGYAADAIAALPLDTKEG